MSKEFFLENAIRPITALNLFELGRVYLVAGEAKDIKVFDHSTGRLLAAHRVFESDNIHGIVSCVRGHEGHDRRARLLLWGVRSLCVVELFSESRTAGALLNFDIVIAEAQIGDWILDACFHPLASEAEDFSSLPFEAVVITAHNQLRSVRFADKDAFVIHESIMKKDLATNQPLVQPNALLYSAHIHWSEEDHVEGRVLVAAGTVFGEVHLWSSKYDSQGRHGALRLHYTFMGHLGSVFGVQILEKSNDRNRSMTRLLASCSDDRTIRIWDISELKNVHSIGETTRCLATVMGHTSRIWTVRFLSEFGKKVQLLSTGEDGTAQVWLLQPARGKILLDVDSNDHLELVHDTRYHYHFGKNIWAIATLEKGNGTNLIATGGADGRIVSYQRGSSDVDASTGTISYQSTTDQVAQTCKTASTLEEAATNITAIFDALQGQWTLSRTLQSALAAHPSGMLDGVANIQKRPVTEPDFSEESLYSEEGDFVTDKGFRMKAKRQYVYRFQQEADEMSNWFVKSEGQGQVDYLFHRLQFTNQRSERPEGTTTWTARGNHLCINDQYNAEYTFEFRGQTLEKWRLKFIVKGPEKDYVADATYSRFLPESGEAHPNFPADYASNVNGKIQRRSMEFGAFKSYGWISDKDFLTTTDLGNVLIGTPHAHGSTDVAVLSLPALSWESVGHISGLSSSPIVSNIYSAEATFIIGTDGRVFRYNSRSKTLKFVVAQQRKPCYLKAQEVQPKMTKAGNDGCGDWGSVFKSAEAVRNQSWISLITTSIASDKAIVSAHAFNEQVTRSIDDQFSIQLPKGFILTSSCVLDKGILVILGSRNGDLLIYDPLAASCKPGSYSSESVFAGVHSVDSITNIQSLSEKRPASYPGATWIITTGRNGKFAVHQITFSNIKQRNSRPELETFHESALPFGPNIEGAHVDSTNHDLLIWGFHSTQFVVWNETKKMVVMTIECGGAHRHWAYRPLNDGNGGGNFVWTKASVCNVHTQTEASHRVLQFGGHGREIKALAVAPDWKRSDGSLRRVIATGAEDTTIRLFEYDAVSGHRCVRVNTKHTTGIQKLRWGGSDDQYLFSAAGCEEFFVWKVAEVPALGIGITSVLVCPNVTEDKDLRIMDFAVTKIQNSSSDVVQGTSSLQLIAMVYSDSSVRIFAFRKLRSGKHSLTLLLEGCYSTRCLTHVVLVNLKSETYLCTASTDGQLALWSLTKGLAHHGYSQSEGSLIYLEPKKESSPAPKEISWQKRFPVHQNSIKCLVHVQLSHETCLILTCGDDQALALTSMTAQEIGSTTHHLRHGVLLLTNAHTSAVTALTYLRSKATEMHNIHSFASVGNDQKLQLWEVIDTMQGEGVERFSVRKKMHAHTSIADASALSALAVCDQEPIRLCVAGIGIETWSVGGRPATAYRK